MICAGGEEVTPTGVGVPSLHTMGVQMARIIRFAGATRDIWTVLPHSLVVMALMPEEYAIHGLMHDVPEICTGDVPTPWKSKAAESNEAMLLDRIYKHYDIPPLTKEASKAVKEADMKALAAEAHVLGHPAAHAVWPEYDEEAAELVSKLMSGVHQFMLLSNVAGETFEEAYEKCKEVSVG